MTKNAQDLKINDVFYHDELKPWKVIEQPVIPVSTIIEIKAEHTVSKRKRTFKFGRLVTLDLPNNYPVS